MIRHTVRPLRRARRCGPISLVAAVAGVAMLAVAARSVGAQAHGVVAGSVRAADESRLSGARVELAAIRGHSGTDSATSITGGDGAFRFESVPDGTARLIVRRLGFRPETLSVEVPQVDGGAIVVMLERVAQPLAPVVVRESGPAAGPLPSAFERRRSSGFGHYITRAEIERRNPMRPTDLLRTIPGVTVGGPDGARSPRFRAAGGAACEPSYYLNGVPVSAAIDLDAMSVQSIEALEVYSGAATVPAALRSAAAPGGCGAIAIWSRMADPAVAYEDEADGLGADSLARRVATGWAYTADQVELQANPLPGMGPSPGYPDALRKAATSGRVVAEFVVDEQGRVDASSINIVSSTHPLLSAAVRASVGRARFAPAYRQNHVVRQVVNLPVIFDPGAPAVQGP